METETTGNLRKFLIELAIALFICMIMFLDLAIVPDSRIHESIEYIYDQVQNDVE